MSTPRSGPQAFPGGSKSRVNRAGDRVRLGTANHEDLAVIEEWRAAHRSVLNNFQAILHARAKGKSITVAQRHKRKRTVFDKLVREPKMSLSRMDDVAGCRLIFKSLDDLHRFRASLHKARFKHKRRHEPGKYDYIARPKPTGYRGIHDVYEYDVNSDVGRRLTGLYVEIQFRTRVQHAWSTANEVIGQITESEPKFQRGDPQIIEAMALASEILSRAHEGCTGPRPELKDRELVRRFLELDQKLGLLTMFRQLHTSPSKYTKNKNTILIFKDGDPLQMMTFRDAPDALRELFRLENEHPEWDIVLVRAESVRQLKIAFTNYFTDAREFLQLLDDACTKLTSPKNIMDVYRPLNVKKSTVSKGPKQHREWWLK